VVPEKLAAQLYDLLRSHFRDEPSVEVIVEARARDRRSGGERRASEPPAGDAARAERRQIRARAGRRVGERRAMLAPTLAPELPRKVRRYADQIAFVERVEPAAEQLEDRDTARLVARIQAGESDLFALLYMRYFDRVYGYLRLILRNAAEAEDAAQQVFLKVLEALPQYERRGTPFRAWLFIIVRIFALNYLRSAGRLELRDPVELDRQREEPIDDAVARQALTWIADRDLLLFIERLPLAQRQVLMLRYALDLTPREVAQVLDRTPGDVRILQHRALHFLNERLTALGRAPQRRGPRISMRRGLREAQVLRSRRFVLAR
jgi:RNA polymerase sigma-70 factor (ECF subfamily)